MTDVNIFESDRKNDDTINQKLPKTINNLKMLKDVTALLDDSDIQIRGEAFSLLILADIEGAFDVLVECLRLPSKNIRAFVALVLANRGDHIRILIPNLVKLAEDESAMVRSCAIGALSHLNANDQGEIFVKALSDVNLEVRNGALHAIIKMGISVPNDIIDKVTSSGDAETAIMISNMM